MAQLFALNTKFKPNMVILLDADCMQSLLRTVSWRVEKFGVKPQTCIDSDEGTVCMHWEAWELESLKSKRLINDFFQMYGKSEIGDASDFYMDIPVEALCLLEEALAYQMRQDRDAFI